MTNRATIKSIAADLGISHMTVSRALSGSTRISPATRDAIVRRAAEVGYVSNTAAKTIRGSRSSTIGLSLPNIENEFYSSLANHVAALAAQRGLQVMIGLSQDDPKVEADVLKRFREQRVGSIAMVPTVGNPQFPGDDDLRVLQVLRAVQGQNASFAGIDDTQAIGDAVGFLARKGRTQIAYLGADVKLSTGRRRLVAFRAAIRKHMPGASAPLTLTVDPSEEAGRLGLAQLLDGQPRPDAIVLGGVQISNGAVIASLERRLRVPHDLHLIGYGAPVWYRWVFGGLPCIVTPSRQLAERIVAWCVAEKGDAPLETSVQAIFQASRI